MDDILGEILVSFLLGRGVGSDGMSQYGLMGQVGTGGDTLLADTQLACRLAFAFYGELYVLWAVGFEGGMSKREVLGGRFCGQLRM